MESVRVGVGIGIGFDMGFGIMESGRAGRIMAAAESFAIGIRMVVPTLDIWA